MSAARTLTPGVSIDAQSLVSIEGRRVPLPDPERLVHLQFRRFAGCPICSVHLREFTNRRDELAAAGIREVVVFHSAAEELRRYRSDLPFDVLADPDRELYGQFGVGRGMRTVLHPRAALTGIRGLSRGASLRGALKRSEDHLGQPADFLISSTGVLLAAQYGSNAADGWTVDEVLLQAADERESEVD